MKTVISLPEDLFAAVEDASRRLGISRNELFTRAIAAYLKERESHSVTEKLNEIYSGTESRLEPLLDRLQLASLDPKE